MSGLSKQHLPREIYDQLDPDHLDDVYRLLGVPDSRKPVSRVVVIMGQSNGAGAALTTSFPPQYQVADPHVFAPTETGESWVPWVPGVTNVRGVLAGFDLSLVTELRKLYPEDDLYVANMSVGSTSLGRDWCGRNTGYTLATAYLRLSSAFRALPPDAVLMGVCWNQGEDDHEIPAYAAAYQTNLLALIHDLRRFLGHPAVPVVASRLPDAGGVRDGVVSLAADPGVINFRMIDQDGLARPDGYHFTANGYVLLGERYAHQLALLDITCPIRRKWPMVSHSQYLYNTASERYYPAGPSNAYRVVRLCAEVRYGGGGTMSLVCSGWTNDLASHSFGTLTGVVLPTSVGSVSPSLEVDPDNPVLWGRPDYSYHDIAIQRTSGPGLLNGKLVLTFEDYAA